MHRKRISILTGLEDRRVGSPGNRGSPRGQVISSTDAAGHTIAECWELLFIANALAPAPYKFTDAELTERMRELFPRRADIPLFRRPHTWRVAYNAGTLHPQKARNGGVPTPPDENHYSYGYTRIQVKDSPDKWPYEIYAIGKWKCVAYRAYPPEAPFRLKRLKHLFKIPEQDWNEFPYPKQAKNLHREIRREREAKEKAAFADYVQEWLKKQRSERPQDFDPLLWKDPKW